MTVSRRCKRTVRSSSLLITLFLGSLLLSGCGQVQANQLYEAAANTDERLVAANSSLAFDLYAEQIKKAGQKNIVISPISIAMALAMAQNGAANQTEQVMAKVLHHQDLSLDELNQAYETLRIALTDPDPKVQLNIANSLWMRQEIPFQSDFITRIKDAFAAEVAELDYQAPDSVRRINDWVSKQTRGKINDIIDKLNGVLTLVNAIYFNGEWSIPFRYESTQDRPFRLLNGSVIEHPLMSSTNSFRYYEDTMLQAIRLPYGSGRMAMYVLLPRTESSLAELHSHLNAEFWEALLSDMSSRRGTIMLPRFKYEYTDNLKDTLENLGMSIAFDSDQADFSRAYQSSTGEKLYLKQVIHKAVIEVNEQGTEAAAVTEVRAMVSSAPQVQEQPFRMIVNRPFFFAIRDDQTGVILFMGSVVNPQK